MLVHVSAGYLPVRGWLHTCYSPVRRSPPAYYYAVLPLDLHVLSLSLAFILSQDQTLHGKSFSQKLLFRPGHVSESRLSSSSIHARYVVCFHVNIVKELFSSSSSPSLCKSESECKDKAFLPFPPNLSRSFFKLFFLAPPSRGNRRERSSSTSPERRLHVNPALPFSLPLFRFGGCKDKANFIHFPNFSTSFL